MAALGARVLILGTLPGRVSLERQEYYAQPRNAFWRIMGEAVGAGPEHGYADRLARLRAAGIALWDVCAEARRPGSLDASIDLKTLKPNPIGVFLRRHPAITALCLNGQGAARLYARYVMPTLSADQAALPRHVLPSTSPAYAAMAYAEKRRRWLVVLARLCAPASAKPPMRS